MKLETQEVEIIRSNDFEGREFQCDISVMSILRNNIYTDKILASIRELACNAYDAHIEAGIPDRPIEITLPSVFDPTFKVRDYGKSMSHELVKSLYSFYGKSSKRNSNTAVGAFGIGKVAPLSYTSAFQLSCIQSGNKRIYTIYINEKGVDQIDLLIDLPSEEPDGTEVSFGVKLIDVNTFQNRCESLFKFWPVYPEIFNCSGFDKKRAQYSLVKDGKWGFLNESYTTQSYVVMGPVAYKLDSSQLTQLSDTQKTLLSKSMVVFVNIGDVSLQASRESIDYSEKTVNYLQKRVKEIEQEILAEVNEKINNIGSELEARMFYKDIFTELGNLGTIAELVKSVIKVSWQNIPIYETFFRLPKQIPAFLGVLRHDRSYVARTKLEDTTIFEYITVKDKTTPNVCRFFYDLKNTKNGRLKNMVRHYLTTNNFSTGDGIYILKPKSIEALRFYCFEKGISFSAFKDINKEVVLPKKVRDPNKAPPVNCRVFDPENILDDEDVEVEYTDGFRGINVDFSEDSEDSGFYLVRHYNHYYDNFQLVDSARYRILHEILSAFDPEFKKNPIIYTFSPKYEEKVTRQFKPIKEHAKALLEAYYNSLPKSKIKVNDLHGYNTTVAEALKEACDKNLIFDKAEIEKILEELDFDSPDVKLYENYASYLNVTPRSNGASFDDIRKLSKKIEDYINQFPMIKTFISSHDWYYKEKLPALYDYINLINSQKKLEETLVTA